MAPRPISMSSYSTCLTRCYYLGGDQLRGWNSLLLPVHFTFLVFKELSSQADLLFETECNFIGHFDSPSQIKAKSIVGMVAKRLRLECCLFSQVTANSFILHPLWRSQYINSTSKTKPEAPAKARSQARFLSFKANPSDTPPTAPKIGNPR